VHRRWGEDGALAGASSTPKASPSARQARTKPSPARSPKSSASRPPSSSPPEGRRPSRAKKKGETWRHQGPAGHGVATLDAVKAGELAVFEEGGGAIEFNSIEDTRFVLGSAAAMALWCPKLAPGEHMVLLIDQSRSPCPPPSGGVRGGSSSKITLPQSVIVQVDRTVE